MQVLRIPLPCHVIFSMIFINNYYTTYNEKYFQSDILREPITFDAVAPGDVA